MKNKIFKIGAILVLFTAIISIYFINQNEYYDIPRVYFNGDITNMTNKEDVREIKVKYISKDKKFESNAKLKIQGTSSLAYEKKNYTITLYEDSYYKDKYKVDMGWGEQSKYCLKANWIDKTHARNIVTAKLASEINEKYNVLIDTPNNGVIDGFPVEIYINNKFLGLYTWNIPKDSWMFNMEDENENNLVFANESWEPPSLFKEKPNFTAFSMEVGEENEENLSKLNRLYKFVRESTDIEFKKNVEKYLDVNATINYIILVQYAQLIDNVAKNMLLATYDGEYWYPILYDLDTSWGTNWDGKSTIKYTDNPNIDGVLLLNRINNIYSKEIAERYFELRKDILTKEYVMKIFNDFKNSIPAETFKKENKRWKDIPGYDYTQIEEFLNERIPYIDSIMQTKLAI